MTLKKSRTYTLQLELDALTEENQVLKAEVSGLEKKVCDEKSRFQDVWCTIKLSVPGRVRQSDCGQGFRDLARS